MAANFGYRRTVVPTRATELVRVAKTVVSTAMPVTALHSVNTDPRQLPVEVGPVIMETAA